MKFGTSILFIALTVATTTEATIRGSTTSSSASNNRRRVRDGSSTRYDGLTNAIDESSLNKIRGRFLQVNAGGAGGAGGQQMGNVNGGNQGGRPVGGAGTDEPDRQDKNAQGGGGGGGNAAMDKNADDETREDAGDKNDAAPEDMAMEVEVDGSMSMIVDAGSMSLSMAY
eukprot:CAMPEP_0170942054 /NCGR_PEP_ID=MMETSP0735-20130129/23917_1 /TAXON_ID=186038 /ORGANISM="Fragilariopsis kerguelensis, Strain L26-C5" /LENGTH=169 /DNA_ID=CAMNT_0011348785 /DNA_START=27 /DNA_END=536 /DNA_ORIENTATION=+